MRKRAIVMWAIGAGVVLALALAMLLGRGPDTSAPEWPDPTLARTADGEPLSPLEVARQAVRPLVRVDVHVTSCQGQLVEGATVLAQVGKEHYGASSDDQGRASIRVPAGATVDRIVAQRAGFEGEVVPATLGPDADLMIDICPGATVFGRVIDQWGHTRADIALELIGANGETLDANESDEDGSYGLTDLALAATDVRVDGELWPISALRAREQRELDLVIGQTRVVSGFVLDLSGDPVPGVTVRLAPMQFDGPGWSATTSGNGGFSFIAPTTALKIDADGGDLGRDRAWVDEGAEKKDVELTLEPVGYITVVKSDADAPDAKVILRNWDQAALGKDRSWSTGPQGEWNEYEVGGVAPSTDFEGSEIDYDGEAEPGLETDEAVAEPHEPSAQEAAMGRVMRGMIRELAPDMMPDGADEMDMMTFQQALEEKAKALTPEQLEELTHRFDGDQVQQTMQRLMASEPELASMAEAMVEQPADTVNEDSSVATEVQDGSLVEPEVMENEPSAAELYGEGPYPEVGTEPSDLDKFGTYAEGVLGEALPVPANLWYDVYVEQQDGTEIHCGHVQVKAGEELTVSCGSDKQESVVEGRFVDGHGKPLGNLDVWLTTSRTEGVDEYVETRALTGADGRFSFRLEHARVITLAVGVGAADDPQQSSYGRRNVLVTPGDDKDLGDLLWIPEGERPEAWPTAAYGGIGGLINIDDNGVEILDMESESPLALAGIEKDDTIVLIDGLPANELPQDEVFLHLRGAPGTQVDLRLRSAEGELYEVTVDRQLMAKPDDTWGAGGAQALDPIVLDDIE